MKKLVALMLLFASCTWAAGPLSDPNVAALIRGVAALTAASGNYQQTLVSGSNIKTLGGLSLLGSGDYGTLGVGYGGTGTNNGSITGTGSLIFTTPPGAQAGSIMISPGTAGQPGSILFNGNSLINDFLLQYYFGSGNTVDPNVTGVFVLGSGNTVLSTASGSTQVGGGHTDGGTNNTIIGQNNTVAFGTNSATAIGYFVKANSGPIYGTVTIGVGAVQSTGNELLNTIDGTVMMGVGSVNPTITITLADDANTTGVGTGEVLVGTVINNAAKDKLQVNGSVALVTAGNGFKIKEGANACQGGGTLYGGTVTIYTTCAKSTSRIFVTDTASTLTNVGALAVTKASGSFTVKSTNVLDASAFDWIIFNPS